MTDQAPPEVKFLMARGWRMTIEADPQTLRLLVKVGHPALPNHAAISYDVREVAANGVSLDINTMMEVAMGIHDAKVMPPKR